MVQWRHQAIEAPGEAEAELEFFYHLGEKIRERVADSTDPRDLPLHCSGPEHADSWNGHPRVFLPIQSDGDIECPYCGTYYHLEGKIHPHHY